MLDRRPKILVADDDPVTLNLIIDVLELDGYRLLVARNCDEAVQLALTHEPDLLLLDVVMPDGSGYDVCETLRARAPHRELPVIFLTGLTQADQIRQGFAAGAMDYITKPFSSGQLRTRVRTWLLRLGKQVDADGPPPDEPEPG
jgi:putative two-component system response regulator